MSMALRIKNLKKGNGVEVFTVTERQMARTIAKHLEMAGAIETVIVTRETKPGVFTVAAI